jgi:rfaE bifunctional protein kinase chain/domain
LKLTSQSITAYKEIIEKTQLKKRLVFLSGNFNIIHPGHLRLLRYASECGDFLVVGVNNKNSVGAVLPEALRLESIRSISFVNYAFILNDKAEDFISLLKPSIVVKGTEYENKDNAEQKAVDIYGGKLLFSSGDITFSSLDLLRKEFMEFNPSTIVQPVDFLKRHNINFKKLDNILFQWKNLEVIVIGDLIIDEYITCDALGMSQEDPTIVVTPVYSEKFAGGAGIVAAHVAGLGAKVDFFTVTGKDVAAEFAKDKLLEYGVRIHFYEDENRPTTLKQRYRANGKTLLRVSHLRQHDITKEMAGKMLAGIKKRIESVNLVIFSDFNYGSLPQYLVDELIDYCKEKNIKMVADSQSSSQLGDVSRFKHMELLTPTEREARLALRDFESGLAYLSEMLISKTLAKNIVTTLGSEGLIIHTSNDKEEEYLTDRLDALNLAPKDVAGAGDSFLVCCSLSLVVGGNIWESSYLGSLAAACQVGRMGNIPITLKEIQLELLKASEA